MSKANLLFFWMQSVLFIPVIAQEAFDRSPGSEDSIMLAIGLSAISLVKGNKVLLQWKSYGLVKEGFFIIERSGDKKVFEVIGAVKAGLTKHAFDFIDEGPVITKNYYRIKMPVTDEKNIYSPVISTGYAGNIFCKFYPNPVDNLLIVRSDHPVELKITDAMGKVRLVLDLQPGLQSVDVSALERSIYILTLSQKKSNQVVTHKLIKN